MKKSYFLIIFVMSSILFSINCNTSNDASDKSVKWTTYTTNNSILPSNDILCIAVDANNNKWIGTSEGLVKYDNINWTVYTKQNSGIAENYIYLLYLLIPIIKSG